MIAEPLFYLTIRRQHLSQALKPCSDEAPLDIIDRSTFGLFPLVAHGVGDDDHGVEHLENCTRTKARRCIQALPKTTGLCRS